jgi:protein-L-isoaspartate(D-aspartate) O-methyltransferase
MSLTDWRRFYAEEIRWCAGVKTPGLVDAFARVPREEFLGPPPWLLSSPEVAWSATGGTGYTESSDARDLYHNILVALDAPRRVNNGQPSALARWIDSLELKAGNRVYHVGCGVGYYTAILAEVVGTSGRVVASEVDAGLAARAQANLAGYGNVVVHAADGATVVAGECDAVLINAGVTHPHPRWLDQLSDGGRMVLPLTAAMPQTPDLGRGAMMKLVRKGDAFAVEMVTYVGIYSCTSVRDAEMNSVIGPSLAAGALGKVKSLRRDAHEKGESCVVHGGEACWSSIAAGA